MNQHNADDISDADLERLIQIDDALGESEASTPVDVDSATLRRATRSLDFIKSVRQQSPHCVDDLAVEATMPSWFEMDGGQPKRIGRHEIIERLGTGGFGVVFLAVDPELDRQVALKVPRVETLIHTQTRRRFLRESKTAAQLEHPHIATIYEAGTVGPIFYIASQYCPGGSLDDYLFTTVDGRLPPRSAAHVMTAICEAADYAHRRGILHRDIKPSNILLDTSPDEVSRLGEEEHRLGQVARLVDFGLAKNLHASDEETKSGIMLGTPAYTAPEMVLERPNVGVAADVYSLGATLYHLLTGTPPHKKETKFETLLAAQKLEATPPSRRAPLITADLDAICLKSLEREPTDRYASAAAMADDLRNYLAGHAIQARRVTRLESVFRWSRRNSLVASLMLALSVLAFVTATSLFYTWHLIQSSRSQSRQLERQIKSANVRGIFDRAHRVVGTLHTDADPAGPPRRFDLSPDGRLAALGRHDGIELWDIVRGQQLFMLPTPAASVAFCDNGESLIAATRDQRLSMYRFSYALRAGARTISIARPVEVGDQTIQTDNPVLSRQQNGTRIAFQPQAGTVCVVDTSTQQTLLTREFNCEIASLALSPDGTLLAVALEQRNRFHLISTVSDQVIGDFRASHPRYVTFSPSGRELAIAEGSTLTIRTRPNWDVPRNVDTSLWLPQVAYSADARFMAVATDSDVIQLVEPGRSQPLATVAIREDESICQILFTHDRRRLAARTNNGRVYLWDLLWIDDRLKPHRYDWQFSTAGPLAQDGSLPCEVRWESDDTDG